MKIIVLGAGAIGSIYGAKLSKLNDITLIGRKEHVDNINKNGLKISGIENKTYRLKASLKIKNIEKNTLILLTTKVSGNKDAIDNIKNLIRKDSIILCLQNGYNSEGIVKKIVGEKCLVLRGVTSFGGVFLNSGAIKYNNYGFTSIENSSKSLEIAKNFSECGLNANVSKNIKKDAWNKLILNCALNPVSAILKITNGEVAHKALNPIKKRVIDECLKIAKKDGISFKIDFLKMINTRLKGSKNISSMYQDLIKGKKTEIDYLNGAVVELGRKYGIKCPVNESLVSVIKFLEKKNN